MKDIILTLVCADLWLPTSSLSYNFSEDAITASSRFTVCKEYLIHSILIFTKVLEGLTLRINSIYEKQKHRFSEKSGISQSYMEITLKPE